MSAKLEKIAAEREKCRIKRDEWDAKVRELDEKWREQENIEIQEIVHAAGFDLDKLAKLIESAKEPKVPSPSTIRDIQNMEEFDND